MTLTTNPPMATAEELAGRLLEATLASMDVFSVYLGEKLGWYASLAKDGPATSAELAARTSSNERYAREWLEQQTTTGFLALDSGETAETRRYSLPDGYEAILVDRESEMFVAPVGRFLASIAGQAPALVDAYRTGGGVSWQQFGEDARTAQADFNRPFFQHHLAADYLAQIAGVDAALKAPGARVAEIGPGGGWAAIAVARAYPTAKVDGFDLDAESVRLAVENVRDAGLSDRVTIQQKDAGDPAIDGQYDLVAAYECIHDMSDPVSALATMRRLAKPEGTVIVMDEKVAEEFGAIGDFNERLFYGFSLGCCLPDGMSHPPSAGTGTVMRPSTLRGYAQKAGFSDIEILPLEHEMYRFYRLLK